MSDDHVRTVRRIYEAFVAADLPTLLPMQTQDIEMVPPISSGPTAVAGWGRTWRGHDEAARYLSTLAEALEFQAFEADEFIAGQDAVVVLGHERCLVRATGRLVEVRWVQVFTFRDGKVSRHREYSDTAAWEAGFVKR
jgi:uncharacterized protein